MTFKPTHVGEVKIFFTFFLSLFFNRTYQIFIQIFWTRSIFHKAHFVSKLRTLLCQKLITGLLEQHTSVIYYQNCVALNNYRNQCAYVVEIHAPIYVLPQRGEWIRDYPRELDNSE